MDSVANIQHKDLAQGRWKTLSTVEQLANIGSEVHRTIQWRKKDNKDYSEQALMRAMELIELTLEDSKNSKRLKEIARLKECLNDYFLGENEYGSSDDMWEKYFMAFNYHARNHQS